MWDETHTPLHPVRDSGQYQEVIKSTTTSTLPASMYLGTNLLFTWVGGTGFALDDHEINMDPFYNT